MYHYSILIILLSLRRQEDAYPQVWIGALDFHGDFKVNVIFLGRDSGIQDVGVGSDVASYASNGFRYKMSLIDVSLARCCVYSCMHRRTEAVCPARRKTLLKRQQLIQRAHIGIDCRPRLRKVGKSKKSKSLDSRAESWLSFVLQRTQMNRSSNDDLHDTRVQYYSTGTIYGMTPSYGCRLCKYLPARFGQSGSVYSVSQVCTIGYARGLLVPPISSLHAEVFTLRS
jgi:hypothetical protein